jgi:Ca-activated chloride channel family protein
LWLLCAVPVLVAAYLYAVRRRRVGAAQYAGLAATRDAPGKDPRFRRYLPPLLFLLALVAMIIAIARPVTVVALPSQHEVVVLAMDVSGSMRATDVKPNRLAAAQAAARAFVNDQPHSTRIGVVAFAATAAVVQHPTQNREEVLAAIDRLQMQRGTALGDAIVIALGTILPGQGITLESVQSTAEARRRSPRGAAIDGAQGTEKGPRKTVQAGSYTSAAIVLLTDGQATGGSAPLDAARAAADRGVRIFTIGIGTPGGETMAFEGWRVRVRLDEETLKSIADVTRGQYFYAGNAKDLKRIYESLKTRFVMQKKETEVTAIFAGAAALLAIVSAMISLLWFNRIL